MPTDKGFYNLAFEDPHAVLKLAGITPNDTYDAPRVVLLKDKDREVDNFFSHFRST